MEILIYILFAFMMLSTFVILGIQFSLLAYTIGLINEKKAGLINEKKEK